jgi:DNA polymerase elongation subunit (family B)
MMQHNFIIANGDTDSIAFRKLDEKPFTTEERAALLAELNAMMPENVVWKDDDHFRRFIVFKAKNYVMDNGKKVKIKGSALKGGKKEPALKTFMNEVIDLLLKDRKEQILFLYLQKVSEIHRLTDITPWCFKVTVTKKVLEPEATFQKKIRDAIGSHPVLEGDKVYLFFMPDGSLRLRENFDGEVDKSKLLGKLRDTIDVFGNVFDVDLFPDLTLKRNQELLKSLTK